MRSSLSKIEHDLEVLYNKPETPSILVQIAELEAAADILVDAENAVRDAMILREKEAKRIMQEKIDDITSLVKLGKTEELVKKYGHEFVNDYEIDGNTITSNVANKHQNDQWTVNDVDSKLNQLIYYRIYDHYLRSE